MRYQIFRILYFVFTYMYISRLCFGKECSVVRLYVFSRSYYDLYINPNTHWYIQNKLEIIVWRNRYRCTIDRGCQHRSEQTKYYEIDICCFSALSMSMRKNWSSWNQDNMYECGDFSSHGLRLQRANTIKSN